MPAPGIQRRVPGKGWYFLVEHWMLRFRFVDASLLDSLGFAVDSGHACEERRRRFHQTPEYRADAIEATATARPPVQHASYTRLNARRYAGSIQLECTKIEAALNVEVHRSVPTMPKISPAVAGNHCACGELWVRSSIAQHKRTKYPLASQGKVLRQATTWWHCRATGSVIASTAVPKTSMVSWC